MIWCLHGFLGTGRDWIRFAEVWSRKLNVEVRTPDLFAAGANAIGAGGMEQWAARFAAGIERVDPAPVIVGYSMGGRLALHAILERPKLFRAAVIISAGLGIEGDKEREQRRARDDQWAQRFESDTWDAVVAEWNRQPVFAGSSLPETRVDRDFDRASLAAALRQWSPGAQQPLASRVRELDLPVLWTAGELDSAYAAIGRRAVKLLPKGELWIAEGCGHRVPWECPEQFTEKVARWLEGV